MGGGGMGAPSGQHPPTIDEEDSEGEEGAFKFSFCLIKMKILKIFKNFAKSAFKMANCFCRHGRHRREGH
jgi:hypothetical protein